jgi:teichuronic acid biosynthesis glycosyltransferase TuaG
MWLEEAVHSAYKQTYKNFEIIIINDGSLENDERFLKENGDKIEYHKTSNRGPAAARNFGIMQAKGEYIAFLDSDDLWESNKLEKQLDYMVTNNFEWSHTGYSLFDDKTGLVLKDVKVNEFYGDVFIKCLVSSPIATPCIMVKREFLVNNPEIRFSENMRYGQDGFMWLNISRYAPLGVIPESLSKVRIRGGNAALRARVYIGVKSQLWSFISKKIALSDERYKSLPFLIKCIYKLCFFNDGIINAMEKRWKLSKGMAESIAKLLYFPPYLMLKFLKLKIK